MPKVVMFSVFFPSVSSTSAVWAQTKAHQEHSNAASIFFMIAPYRWWDKLYPEPLFLLRPVLVRIVLRWNWNPRCPFQPSLRRLLVQGEYRPAPHRPGLRIVRGGEGDPPRHQRPHRPHLADPHAAVLDRRSTGLEAAAVLKSDRDRQTVLPNLDKDEISRHQCCN